MFKKILDKVKPRNSVEETVPEEIITAIKAKAAEKGPKDIKLDEMLLNFLTQEFTSLEAVNGLQPSMKPMAPPLAVLKYTDGALSLWHRLPMRGESGVPHLPDFVLFKGAQRMSPREKNPDFLIECRNMDKDLSNRTDVWAVQDMIGRSLELLPGMSILVTNREISSYAKGLAAEYGIQVVEIESSADPGYRLFKMLVSEEQPTREKLLQRIQKLVPKLQHQYKPVKKEDKEAATAGGLRERTLKYLQVSGNTTVAELSIEFKVHDALLLNQMYTLEKEGKIKGKKTNSPNPYRAIEWSLTKGK